MRMRISFRGICRNALNGVAILDAGDEDDTAELRGDVKACISAYHDTILALAKGQVDLEEVKDFWFDKVDIDSLDYIGGVVTFSDKQ